MAGGLTILAFPMNKLIAWGAGNLIASLSSRYYLESLRAVADGFIVKSWMSPLQYGFELHSLLLGFGLPVAFALSLPGAASRGYWVRLLTTVLASYWIAVLVVALVADRSLISNFAAYGLELQPAWRRNFSQTVVSQLWAFTTVGFPFFVIMLLGPATGQLPRDLERYFGSSNRPHPTRALMLLSAILVLCIAVDPRVREGHRATGELNSRRYFEDIEALNPDHLGAGLIELAQSLETRGDLKAAINVYRVAKPHLTGEALQRTKQAIQGLAVEQRRPRFKRKARLRSSEGRAATTGVPRRP